MTGSRFRGRGGPTGFRPGSQGPFTPHQIQRLVKVEFDRARRHGHPLTVMVARVDRLENLVDLHGSPIRDAVQNGVTEVIDGQTRSIDLLGRLSEDRFLLVLPHTDGEGARVVGERIRSRVAGLSLEAGGRGLTVTVSLGGAVYMERNALFCDAVIQAAEGALAQAREHGGNRVRVVPAGEPDQEGEGPPGSP